MEKIKGRSHINISYQNYSNVFVILDYEITADSAVYLHLHRSILKLRSLVEKINNFDRDVFI